MTPRATTADAVRLRLLGGVVLRLARRPDVDQYVVRGGMLLRHWLRPLERPVDDLDLIAGFPFGVAEAEGRMAAVLADRAVADGVAFDPDRLRAEGIWLDSGQPGVRVFAAGEADGVEVDFHVDLTFGPPPRPPAVVGRLPTPAGDAVVWMCRPEAVAGQKVQALRHRGPLGWRPKDLDDLRRVLARVPMAPADLRAAVRAYLADVGAADAGELFGPGSWWGTKLASARWLDYAAAVPGLGVPRDLAAVAAEVGGRLAAVLGGDA